MKGVHGNQNDANYGAGNYRPHKNSHHHDNWTDPNPKWNKYKKQEEKGGKGSSKGKGGKGKCIPPVGQETTTDCIYILTPARTTEHPPPVYQTTFLLCLIWLVWFLLAGLGAFSQLNLASFVAQQ